MKELADFDFEGLTINFELHMVRTCFSYLLGRTISILSRLKDFLIAVNHNSDQKACPFSVSYQCSEGLKRMLYYIELPLIHKR